MEEYASDSLKQEMLHWDPLKLNVSFITKTFGHTTKMGDRKSFNITPPRIRTNMKVRLKAGEYINKSDVITTAGRILWNKLMVEGRIDHVIPGGYVNDVLNGKAFGKIMDLLGRAIEEKKIQLNPDFIRWLSDYEFWSLKLSPVFTESFGEGTITPNKELLAERDSMLAKHDLTNVQDMAKLEDDLVAKANKLTEGSVGKDIYNSGARGSFANDYKNMSLMVGPVKVPGTDDYDFIPVSYLEGIRKEDIVAAGNAIVSAEYLKAVGTQVGGYKTKQVYAEYQAIQLGDDGTDCGTTGTIRVYLTKELKSGYLYQNIVGAKGEIICLDSDTYDKYLNTWVNMRSPLYCRSDKICSVCAGKRPYNIGIQNIGLVAPAVSNGLMNKSMKVRHSAKVTMDKVDINKLDY